MNAEEKVKRPFVDEFRPKDADELKLIRNREGRIVNLNRCR
jgi:hypothetical protein